MPLYSLSLFYQSVRIIPHVMYMYECLTFIFQNFRRLNLTRFLVYKYFEVQNMVSVRCSLTVNLKG